MKDLAELNFTKDVRYSKEHTWAKLDGENITIGISDYAQDQLGEIIFIELPSVGDDFDMDQVFGVVESVKTASDLYMPVGGKVLEVNEELEDNPELVNEDPFGKGWILRVTIEDMVQFDSLMDSESYATSIVEG